MAKISTYALDSLVSLDDRLIGTDAENSNVTKNFEVRTLFDKFNQSNRAYGSFYDDTDQIALLPNTAYAMTFNSTDLTQGVSVVSGNEITMGIDGIFNIQFSAQLHDTSGGSSTVDIWLAKNGVAVPYTNTKMVLQANSFQIAAWNFFVDAVTNDYYEIMWSTSDVDTRIEHEDATVLHPATPSIILTVNQVG
jgi:hypothetical protein